MDLLTDFLSALNAQQFLREFSFGRNTFARPGIGSGEVADHVVWIDDLLFLYQLKERTKPGDPSLWLDDKVLKKATRQVRSTLALATERGPIFIENDRGHRFDFTEARGAHAYKLVVFRQPAGSVLVPGPRYHVSRSAGFIHIMNWVEYEEVLQRLATPIEFADYLAFREIICPPKERSSLPSEIALLGQYIVDEQEAEPDERYAGALLAQIDDPFEYDLRWLMDGMASRISYATGGPRSYYKILGQLARLSRTELGQLKLRLDLAIEAARSDQFERPYRIVAPRTDCGFLVVPVTRERIEKRLVGLRNLALAAKYDQESRRQVGISIAYESPEFLIDWFFLDAPWSHNPELRQQLRSSYPFRPLRSGVAPRYLFQSDRLEEHVEPPKAN